MNPLTRILLVAAVASVSGHAHLPGFTGVHQEAGQAAHQKPFPGGQSAGFHSGGGHGHAAYHQQVQQPVYSQVQQQPGFPAPPPPPPQVQQPVYSHVQQQQQLQQPAFPAPPPQKPSPAIQYGYSHQTSVGRRPSVSPPAQYVNPAAAAGPAQHVRPAAAAGPAQHVRPAAAAGPAQYVNPAAAAGQAQYANPAAAAAYAQYTNPAAATAGHAQYTNPAAAAAGHAQYANPAAAATGHAQYANPAAAAAGHAQYANPAAAAAGHAQYANPAAAAGQAQYANPAAAAGYAQYANPAGAAPPAYGYNNIVTTTTPIPIDSQYQRLDQYGQYTFGFSGGDSDRTETRDAQGNVSGSYTYIDSDGKTQTQYYVADELGFRVSGTNLPKGPDALGNGPSVAAAGPQDTPEVAAAKARFMKAFEEAALLAEEAPDTQ